VIPRDRGGRVLFVLVLEIAHDDAEE